MHRSKFDPICSVNEISLGLLRKAHTLTRQNNGARALLSKEHTLHLSFLGPNNPPLSSHKMGRAFRWQ